MRAHPLVGIGLVVACGARSALDGSAPVDASLDTFDADVGQPEAPGFGDASPPDASFDAGLLPYTMVRAGNDHTCAALPTGNVKCWGDNSEGELGDGTLDDSAAAVDVAGLSGVTAIAAGYRHTCALLQDGTVRCWGYNNTHQVSTSYAGYITTPTATGQLDGPAVAIACGMEYSCATLASGPTECWGSVLNLNSAGNGGDPRVATPLGTAVQLVASTGHAVYEMLARDSAGNIVCWDGFMTYAADCKSPKGTSFGFDTGIVDMGFFSFMGGPALTCVIAGTTLECMTDTAGWWSGVPLTTKPAKRVEMMSDPHQGDIGCVLHPDDTVECAGNGQPWTDIGLTDVTDLTTGPLFACASVSAGNVYCWNDVDGDTPPPFTPTAVANVP